MIRLIFSLVLIAAAAFARAAEKPNIVIILADDVGWSDIGCMGSEIPTPNLDAMAAAGLRFTHFYNAARCCPTRASLLTGLHPHQAGVGHMTDDGSPKLEPGYARELNRRCRTIAEVLKPAGYRTYAAGKWHVAFDTGPGGPKHNWPLQRGFDRFYGTITGAGDFFDPATLTRDNTTISAHADPEYPLPDGGYYYTDALTDHAARFIGEHRREHAGEPFFLYLAYTAAHWPLHAPEEEIAKHRGRYDAGYDVIRRARWEKQKQLGIVGGEAGLSPTEGDWSRVADKAWEARCMEVYAAQISRMDAGIGRVLASLRETGQLENTLVFFLQDNGACAEELGRQPKPRQTPPGQIKAMSATDFFLRYRENQTRDGRPMRTGVGVMPGPEDTYISYGKNWANVSNTPFREYKHWVHEGGIATPLIVQWPAKIAARGELRAQPGHLIDLMATCVEVSDAKYPANADGETIAPLEGRSLVPAFANKPIGRDALFWEHEGNRAMREGNWKLVAKGPAGKWELYDLAADRSELRDLAAEQPERVRDMTAKWEAWARRADVLPWPWKPPYPE